LSADKDKERHSFSKKKKDRERTRERKSVVEKEVDDTYVVDHYKVIKYLKTEKERKLSRLLT
jgi:hypothetical protein